MAEYFFELVAEEIPAWMHEGAQSALNERLVKLVETLGVTGDPKAAITINTTPRRIAFMLSGLQLREENREQEVKGPPKKNAFDADGKATQALLGFLKKNNAAPADLLESADEYVRIRKQITGRGTDEILRERVPEIIQAIRWPKMMRWSAGEHSYIRPVHSIVSVFESAHLPIE